MYKKAVEVGRLPPTLNEATITLIPKKGKDLEQVSSYRSVSLLNTDQKVLAKSSAKRFSPHMANLYTLIKQGSSQTNTCFIISDAFSILCMPPDTLRRIYSS